MGAYQTFFDRKCLRNFSFKSYFAQFSISLANYKTRLIPSCTLASLLAKIYSFSPRETTQYDMQTHTYYLTLCIGAFVGSLNLNL